VKFVEIAEFDSRLEAETVGHALDQFEIPFLVQSAGVGMFGLGMVGKSPVPVSLCVPDNRLEEVRELLSCVAGPAAEGDEPVVASPRETVESGGQSSRSRS